VSDDAASGTVAEDQRCGRPTASVQVDPRRAVGRVEVEDRRTLDVRLADRAIASGQLGSDLTHRGQK